MKSTHRRSDFTRRRRISHREAVFHPPERVDFVEKSTCLRKCFFLSLVTEITGAVSAGYSRKIKEKNRSAFCSRSNLEKANSLDAPNLTALKTYLGLIYDIIGNGLSVSLLSNFSSPITGCSPPPHHSPVASQIS